MITGDHAITAQTIAKKVGLSGKVLTGPEIEDMSSDMLQRAAENISVFARVSPEHKVRICAALQQNGHVVAMTGDGVNDAPAIHRAEVGVSMGKVGTSVARQASDLVLMDDCYATIVAGVEEGTTDLFQY
jgi:Ca2+-transporting ATPase